MTVSENINGIARAEVWRRALAQIIMSSLRQNSRVVAALRTAGPGTEIIFEGKRRVFFNFFSAQVLIKPRIQGRYENPFA